MQVVLSERARALITTSAQSLGGWALHRLSGFLLRAQSTLTTLERAAERAARQPVTPTQRFGARLWQRITTRFPSLEGLVEETVGTARSALDRAAAASSVPQAQGVWGATNGSASSAVLDATDADAVSVDDLLARLRDPSAETAAYAASELSAHREPRVTIALLAALENADGFFNPLTRVAALHALLAQLPAAPTQADLEPLIEPLTARIRDVDAEVSLAAIDAIAQRAPGPVAIELLLPVVLDDSGFFLPVVRSAASRALERAGLMSTS